MGNSPAAFQDILEPERCTCNITHPCQFSFPFRGCAAFIRSRNQQAIVELAMRQQLATYSQMSSKPRLTPLDRAFWLLLPRFWSGWRDHLVIVEPNTVIRWHHKGFRLYWQSISKRGPGRPPISEERQELIRRLADGE